MFEFSTVYHGVCNEAKAGLIYAKVAERETPITIVVVASPKRASELSGELETYRSWEDKDDIEILYFPENPPPDIDALRRADRIGARLNVLGKLVQLQAKNYVIVLTPEALLGECPSKKRYEDHQLTLEVGTTVDFTGLNRQLVEDLDYDSEAICEEPGQIATRGGLIDIYPFNAKNPYRVDFFGDEIESIRTFDPTTQLTVDEVSKLRIASSVRTMRNEHESLPDGNFLSYLPESSLAWILEEPAATIRDHPYRFEKVTRKREASTTSFTQLKDLRNGKDRLFGICTLDTDTNLFEKSERIEVQSEPTLDYRPSIQFDTVGEDRFEHEKNNRTSFENQIRTWIKDRYQIDFVVADKSEQKRIKELFVDTLKSQKSSVAFRQGKISGGYILHGDSPSPLPIDTRSAGRILILSTEYFGRQTKTVKHDLDRARPHISQVDQLLDFTELADGDPLVHLQHGVCLFRGLTKLDIKGSEREVISVEFAEDMTIHVPLQESHLLSRYVGLSKASPKLGKIGGSAWEKTRAAAERATLDYAAEMLQLHARRANTDGYAFPPDHPWQAEFEAAFPFKPTPDQLSAIEATKQDMESPKPMDRLICGDVGFGKTEVAIRAVLKCVLAGKQAAVLVPTTVLCQQHFTTFRERMAQYPIIIEMVSRFRSTKQNKEAIAQLAEGKIDIVVGTHRLLSKDVHFKDLGLLVVDEEQRFGVKQKESLKKLRTNVDILTLSATPIPRTLYMAMVSARAMSVIETAPVDRKPIETIVRSYDEGLIKSAIQAETDRGGQVFYLHNRVDSIQGVAAGIEEMLPKLKVAVGHGQMTEGALEKIMTRFVAGEFDVLVCTTIIESGIDIPNCNTLIIEGADRFGLAQLYQIRGRVGRFKRQAYAYLLLHRHAALVDQAQKRLNALKQHNQLGAGFRIAMRDLELRGAGNLLGAQQSGHIAGIGFELYCQLLKQSVARLKGEPGADRIRAEIKLDFVIASQGGERARSTSGTANFKAIKDAEYENRKGETIGATLPPEYIGEARLRIDFYRRLSMAENIESVEALALALKDRFGKYPIEVEALISVTRIRIHAENAGIRRVETEGDRLIARLAQPSAKSEFLKIGSRFPRMKQKGALKRLKEIEQILKKNRRRK